MAAEAAGAAEAAEVAEATLRHTIHFGQLGLRTLVFAKREVCEEEATACNL